MTAIPMRARIPVALMTASVTADEDKGPGCLAVLLLDAVGNVTDASFRGVRSGWSQSAIRSSYGDGLRRRGRKRVVSAPTEVRSATSESGVEGSLETVEMV